MMFSSVDPRLDSTSTLKMWAPTRWDSRWETMDVIIKNYPAILRAFEEIIDDGGDRSIDARGLVLAVKEPTFLVTLCVLHRLMSPIKILSDQLKSTLRRLCLFDIQKPCYSGASIDYGSAAQLISSVITQFENMRNEESFKLIYNDALKLARDNNINLEETTRARRQTNIPIRFHDSIITGTMGHREKADNEEKFRQIIYYSALDCILVELKARFSEESMQLSRSISALNPESLSFLNLDVLKPLATHLNHDHQTLGNELAVLVPMMRKRSKSKTINDVLHELHPMENAFPTVVSLVKGGMTIPVSSTTCERTFSKMKVIKTYLRNSMTDERLSDLAVLAVERDIHIDFEDVVNVFARNHKNSRIMLF
jgi:hAT family C-terminal dimerisation region